MTMLSKVGGMSGHDVQPTPTMLLNRTDASLTAFRTDHVPQPFSVDVSANLHQDTRELQQDGALRKLEALVLKQMLSGMLSPTSSASLFGEGLQADMASDLLVDAVVTELSRTDRFGISSTLKLAGA